LAGRDALEPQRLTTIWPGLAQGDKIVRSATASSSAHPVEFFRIPDLAGCMTDGSAGKTMQSMMAQFTGLAAAREFMVAEKLRPRRRVLTAS
jgi:hypothetical protein